jgi:hypothetical protein
MRFVFAWAIHIGTYQRLQNLNIRRLQLSFDLTPPRCFLQHLTFDSAPKQDHHGDAYDRSCASTSVTTASNVAIVHIEHDRRTTSGRAGLNTTDLKDVGAL